MNRLRAFIRLVPYWAVFWPFWLYFRFVCRGHVENEEVIRSLKDNGFIIAANHVSYFDWIVLHIYFLIKHDIKITFFAKSKVLNHPLWGKLVSGGKCIAIDRNLIVNNSLNRNLLAESRHFVIFPEGTRSGDGNLLKAKKGVIRIAQKTGLPIIPTALIGFYELWPRNRWLPGINRLQIVFGSPCNNGEGNNAGPVEAHARYVMQKIAGLMGKRYDY